LNQSGTLTINLLLLFTVAALRLVAASDLLLRLVLLVGLCAWQVVGHSTAGADMAAAAAAAAAAV
jgi:hypothetical protein